MKRAIGQLRQLLPFLPNDAKRFMIVYAVTSSLLAILDVVALMLLATSMSAMMAGTNITIPLIGKIGPSGYVVMILVISLLILGKSVLSLLQQWHATRKYASYEMQIGEALFEAYIGAPWVMRLSRTTSQLVRMADVGVSAVTTGFLLPLTSIPQLLTTSLGVILVLAFTQPLTAAISIVYLGLVALLLYKVLSKRSVEAGRVNRNYSFRVASLMTDMVGAMKEVTLRDKTGEVSAVVQKNRAHSTRARANISFLGSVPKFVLDSALIGGFLLVGGGVYFFGGGQGPAIAAIAMFAVAGMRLLPAITGFQSYINTVTANLAQVEAVIMDINEAQEYVKNKTIIGRQPIEGNPKELALNNVTFTYPTRTQPAVDDVNLEIPFGTSMGIVGQSGSGKTTLIDIILGLLEPQSGQITLGDNDLSDVLYEWRKRVGYVPQEVALFDGTIAQNVALSWSGDIDVDKVEECLRKARLWEVVKEREGGMNARIGERGMAFSGGQRQRLGIARALYSDPLVLILDEATSALDTKTEAEVSEAIHALKGEVTTISVAHRLSTIKDADRVCYMEEGQIISVGPFREVVDSVPAFREQAQLAGLLR